MATSSSSDVAKALPVPSPPSFFPSHSLDQAFAGILAGIVSTLCMQPLDLLKVQLQVASSSSSPPVPGHPLRKTGIYSALRTIVQRDGVQRGLYRGLTPNLVGNASSWGLYFLWYTMLKDYKTGGDERVKLGPGQHLLCSAQSGIITAVMTNPLWVIKTRMFTTSRASPEAYRGVTDGLYKLATREGLPGLSKGLTLALFGVSNGALQFMTYEELKRWRSDAKRRRLGPGADEAELKTLSNTEYILMSGSAKLVAIGITYPYQVIRSRIQYQPLVSELASSSSQSAPPPRPYTSIPDCIRRTYLSDGLRGFYKGLGTNAVRILPGTCVTFVVYEQVSGWLSRRALASSRSQSRSTTDEGASAG